MPYVLPFVAAGFVAAGLGAFCGALGKKKPAHKSVTCRRPLIAVYSRLLAIKFGYKTWLSNALSLMFLRAIVENLIIKFSTIKALLLVTAA